MIALCDQRAFYASCESVFRPDLRSKPIAVLSNNDGCIVALNNEAKTIGLQKFAPYFQQRAIAEQANAHIFSSNYALYGEISKRIMATLKALTPCIEVYSIDECFCDLSGIPVNQLKDLGQSLRSTIWQQQRIQMGVSIGATKTLAKLGQFATKMLPSINGVCILENDHQISWLAKRTPVSEVWGVGRRLTETLQAQGITHAEALRRLPLGLARKLGHRPLEQTVRELNGERCIPFESTSADRQSIVCSRSFGVKIETREALEQALCEFAARACEKLRKQGSVCRAITVFIMTSQHTEHRRTAIESTRLPCPSACSSTMMSSAKALLRTLYRSGYQYAKAGIELKEISPADTYQSDFWAGDNTQVNALMKTIDTINHKFGKGAVFLAAQGATKTHAMKQAHLSPKYLSLWSEIPRIKC
ncbi:Y-family DNA polymerase [Marinagarivorans cellulosilyticus]|uniref:DNA polymerase V n=1 Tax=Marinagarivorans cellulosilyticus TaxID=2721545 RepID=A0AAN1WHH3_9GAMM|nr:Y-family DNA polymerase [Marinagarivorans cellulosilyticus]BCD97705.1 DNA polymerase V [Marinagarivorans cellulosilyticus]